MLKTTFLNILKQGPGKFWAVNLQGTEIILEYIDILSFGAHDVVFNRIPTKGFVAELLNKSNMGFGGVIMSINDLLRYDNMFKDLHELKEYLFVKRLSGMNVDFKKINEMINQHVQVDFVNL
jgi:hypothetical protein